MITIFRNLIILFLVLLLIKLIIKKENNNSANNNFSSPKNIPENFSEKTFSENNITDTVTSTKEYKIAGVTFNNEDGKDIQKELKKILKEYVENEIIDKEDMFLGYTSSDIKDMELEVSQYEDISFEAKLEEAIFENKPCVKVYMQRADRKTYTHIGYIPKRYNQIQEVIDILHNYENIQLTLYVVGGKIKKCEVEYDDEYNEKFFVETITLDYGLRLFIEYK